MKWGVVAHLAEKAKPAMAVQLAFYRQARTSDYKLRHLTGGGTASPVAFPSSVTSAFKRRVQQIKEKELGIEVEIYDAAFVYTSGDGEYRNRYIAQFIEWLKERRGERRVVLLVDPDTGLERESTNGPAYIKEAELRRLFTSLSVGDWLVLYQHAPRKKNWVEVDRVRVANALHVDVAKVDVFDCVDVAEDVAFFAVRSDVDFLGPQP